MRSISTPAYNTDTPYNHREEGDDNKAILSDQEVNLSGIEEERKTPDPVQKSFSGGPEPTQQLITGFFNPVVPSIFDFSEQRKNALGNIFTVSFCPCIIMHLKIADFLRCFL